MSGAFELLDLDRDSIHERALDIALIDTIALENSVGRNRAIAAIVLAAVRVRGAMELDGRLRLLEEVVLRREGGRR